MEITIEGKEPSYVQNFKNQTKQNSFVQVLDYVSCLYDNKWWVGIITNVEKEEDMQVKFVHPSGPGRSFNGHNLISTEFLMIIFYVKLTFP